MQTLPKTFTVAQAASALQVSHSTIRRLLKRNGLAHIRVNRSIRIASTALEELLQGRYHNV